MTDTAEDISTSALPGGRARVAVIGGGVSGLTAAHVLAPHADVVLYEADSRLGGHANTVEVDDPRGPIGVDTGFIVLNDTNYPTFRGLLEELGVAIQDSEMGMSMARADGEFEYANTRRGLFAQRSNLASPAFLRLIADQLRFNRQVLPLIGDPAAPTVGEFLRANGYSEFFARNAISPLVSAVWSTGSEGYETFPLGFLAEFLNNHGMLRQLGRPVWQTVTGGSRRYVEALAEGLDGGIRLGAPVRSIEREEGAVLVRADGLPDERFDEVVIAAHSDQALAMLTDPSAAEHEVLGAIGYSANEATLHTDTSLMPRRRDAWASWNFHLRDEPSERTRVTYWMNNLQRLDAERTYLVSLNMAHEIDPASVIATIPYAHPIIDHAAAEAQTRWAEISGADRIHYCGAYWRWAFHEDGCWSGMRAAERLLAGARTRATSGAPR